MTGSLALLVLGIARAAEPPPVPPPRPPPPPVVWSGVLSGDVPVTIVERHGLPLVRVELSFDTTAVRGAVALGALDALGQVWGEGAKAADTRDTSERLGADVSVGCGAVRCWAVLDVPAERLPEALVAVAALVRDPRLEVGSVVRWRREARREWRTDWLGPGIVHSRALGRLTWADGHPYRLDRDAATFRVPAAAVREAWRVVVSEAAASLVVAGDVVPADTVPLLERAFGGLGGPSLPVPVAAPTPVPEGGAHVVASAPGANQAIVSVAWRSPASTDPHHDAYTLAFQALAGGFTSRLNLRLREDEGLTYRVDGGTSAEPGYGWSEVELAVEPPRVGTVLAILSEELERARGEGLRAEEIDAARHQLWMENAVATSTLAGVARAFWLDRRAGQPAGAGVTHVSALGDVSLAEVNAAAAAWLGEPRIWLVSGDTDTLEPALEDAGWPTDTVWGACRAVYGGACPR